MLDKFAGSWQGHYPPLSGVSMSFRKWTEQGALREVLRELWRGHCLTTGIPLSECPMQGLFDTAEVGGASSSSSGSGAASVAAVVVPSR